MRLWSHHGRSSRIFHLIFLSIENNLPLNFLSYTLTQFSSSERHLHKLKLAFNFLMGNGNFMNHIIHYTFVLHRYSNNFIVNFRIRSIQIRVLMHDFIYNNFFTWLLTYRMHECNIYEIYTISTYYDNDVTVTWQCMETFNLTYPWQKSISKIGFICKFSTVHYRIKHSELIAICTTLNACKQRKH